MGYIKHEAIIVTGCYGGFIDAAACRARNLGLTVIGPSAELVNGYQTLTVCPDGSKEGWPESTDAANQRDAFCKWLRSIEYEDGSCPLEWCEVSYGRDDRAVSVLRHAWGALPATKPEGGA